MNYLLMSYRSYMQFIKQLKRLGHKYRFFITYKVKSLSYFITY